MQVFNTLHFVYMKYRFIEENHKQKNLQSEGICL